MYYNYLKYLQSSSQHTCSSAQSCLTLRLSSSMEFPRQEYWSGLPLTSPAKCRVCTNNLNTNKRFYILVTFL